MTTEELVTIQSEIKKVSDEFDAYRADWLGANVHFVKLADIITDRQQRAARAKGSNLPLMLDPKLILDFIDLWHKDPNTPMPDFRLTPGQSHMLTHFIQEEKWKFEKARQNKKA